LALIAVLLLSFVGAITAQEITGTITDGNSGEPLFGASVVITGTAVGATTDFDGKFKFKAGRDFPFEVTISYIGYQNQKIQVTSSSPISIELETDAVMLEGVVVKDVRISEKQKESALTVESMDVIAIKETPAANFYDGLGNLKGVDLTAASIGFKVINTRGFNSTSPVRSLQVIDGVDNQSPGLNFSLGNFLGASELDILKVDIVQGASSAFYGPNAFNGVIDMKTRSPFIKPGLTAQVKIGERRLAETAVRWAQVFKNKEGEDKFAYKLNLFYMQAYDWEADNLNPIDGSPVPANNPGGYDAVNRYGDEDLAGGNDFTPDANVVNYPGLGLFYRQGYRERDLVDYNSRNLKANIAGHYKIKQDVEAILSSSFSYGTTVYQGENRFSLKDILFFQNRIEFKKEGKWFVRAYATNEDAGKSYDAVLTAFKMLNSNRELADYYRRYSGYWDANINQRVRDLPGYPPFVFGQPADLEGILSVLDSNQVLLAAWHEETRIAAENFSDADGEPYAQVGSQEFNDLFQEYTSKIYTDTTVEGGGTRFYDKSALYHIHGEYKLSPSIGELELGEFTFGANGRLYTPDSRGTIFSDTGDAKITNWEFGMYVGWERKFFDNRLKATIAARLDKNQNFPFLVSPAASLVYIPNPDHTIRLSFSSAIRNPTLADQFLYYDVGRAILIGNTAGYENLITLESFFDYFAEINSDTLVYFNMDPVVPEKVQSGEIGYRGFLFKNLTIDASYYLSFYRDFIGYRIGVQSGFSLTGFPTNTQIYRIATNSESNVITQGFSVGLNYYFQNKFALSGNYSWNRLDKLQEEEDPIIPAFNTPEHKFNIGLTGRDIEVVKAKNGWIGFGLNYKWIQGFLFEGSPQFTGEIPSYDMFDAQISYTEPSRHLTFKLGASNLFGIMPLFEEGSFGNRMKGAFDNRNYQVYGGPAIGRLAYFSILFEWN